MVLINAIKRIIIADDAGPLLKQLYLIYKAQWFIRYYNPKTCRKSIRIN